MTSGYLVDTDWVIHWLNGHAAIGRRLEEVRPRGLALSVISLAELYEGVYYSRDPERNERELHAFLRRLLPLKPIAKTYGDRILVIGDAGGFTKPTTGGGIFYSLLTASLATETLVEAFAAGRLDEEYLERYERRWQERLGQELRVGDWLRQLVTRCSDAEIDTLVQAFAAQDVQALIRRTARFNWHRSLILALVRQKGIAALLFRSLFR